MLMRLAEPNSKGRPRAAMLFSNPKVLYIAVLTLSLIFLYNSRMTNSLKGYYSSDVSHTSESEEGTAGTDGTFIQADTSVATSEPTPTPVSEHVEIPAQAENPEQAEPPIHIDTPEELAQKAKDAAARDYLWNNNGTQFLSGSRVALIVEDRPLSNLVPLILHFSSVLGSEWPIVLYSTTVVPPVSAALSRLIKENRVYIRTIPDFVHFGDQAAVSKFLTTPWIWNQLAPADHVLLFQADSMICSNSPQTIEQFVQYDLIGAPIAEIWGHGYNGGLSLRNRNALLNVIHSSSFDSDSADPNVDNDNKFEDQWFYNKMKALPPKADGSPGAILPSAEIAKTFAVETIDYESPFGYHQPQRWQKHNIKKIEAWCPEVKLATGILLINDNLSPEEYASKKEEDEKKEKAEKEAAEAAETTEVSKVPEDGAIHV